MYCKYKIKIDDYQFILSSRFFEGIKNMLSEHIYFKEFILSILFIIKATMLWLPVRIYVRIMRRYQKLIYCKKCLYYPQYILTDKCEGEFKTPPI